MRKCAKDAEDIFCKNEYYMVESERWGKGQIVLVLFKKNHGNLLFY